MPYVTAYGPGEEVDIMIAGCVVPTIPDGIFCVGLAHNPSDEIAINMSAPVIIGHDYTISFQAFSDTSLRVQGNVEIGVSNSNTSFGTLIYTAVTVPDAWVQYTHTFTAPVTGSFLTVRNVNDGVIHWNRIDDFKFVPCNFTIDLGPDTVICPGENMMLHATTPGATYEWQDGSTDSLFNVTGPGVYWVEVTVNGCSMTDIINITTRTVIDFDIGSDTTLCEGDTLQLNATAGNGIYEWQDGSTNPIYNVTQPGTYWVVIRFATCIRTDTMDIVYNSPPVFDLGNNDSICFGDQLILDATVNGAGYLWQDSSVNATYTVTAAGTYWVTVDLHSCKAHDTISISTIALPPLNLGNDSILCPGDTLILDATVPNGSYHWNNGSSNPVYIVTQAGLYAVQVTANTCRIIDTVIVNYNLPFTVDIGSDTTLCYGDTLVLDATTANGVYLWQNNSTDSIYIADHEDIYWVEVSVNGCKEYDSLQVYYNLAPNISIGNDTALCEGSFVQLNASVSGATYLWQDGTINSFYIANQSGIYWVEITVDNCSHTDSVAVVFNEYPLVNLGVDTTLCEGQILFLNAATGNATYHWFDNSGNSFYTVQHQGNYWVTVTVNNCSTTDSVDVAYNDLPDVNIGSDTTLCEGASLLLDAETANAAYIWNDQSVLPTLSVTTSGTYWVSVEVNNCVSIDSILVDYTIIPGVVYGDNMICYDEEIILNAGVAGASYLWQDNSVDPVYTVTSPGVYWVETTLAGCSRTDSIYISTPSDCEIVLDMPNAFTPNNDGINDDFIPVKAVGIEKFNLRIFNRWGQMLAETDDIVNGWNGKFKGEFCVSGTYYWIVEYVSVRNESLTQKGSLTLTSK